MQGTVFTADQAANYLKQYNKNHIGEQTWLNAYNAIENTYGSVVRDLDIAAGREESAALEDYSANIAEAYKTAMTQQNQIAASNLGQGFKNQLTDDTNIALESAYNMYRQNFLKNPAQIKSNLLSNVEGIYQASQEAAGQIDTLLNEQARNTADYLNAHFDYLIALYEKNPELFETDAMQDYVNREMQGGVLTVTGLKDIGAIRNMMFDQSPTGGYELNDRGKDFFRQMQSIGIDEDGYSLGSYLYENSPELYEWSIGMNPYDFTFSDAQGNTNRASALGSIGLGEKGYIRDAGYEWKGGTAAENYASNKGELVNTINSDVGIMTQRTTDSGDVVTELSPYSGDKSWAGYTIKGNPQNKDNYNFKIVMPEGGTYYLEMTSTEDDANAIMPDETLTKVDKAVGGIVSGKLYYYQGNIYYSFVEGNKKILRKVQGQGGLNAGDASSKNNSYKELLKIFAKPQRHYIPSNRDKEKQRSDKNETKQVAQEAAMAMNPYGFTPVW